MGNYTMRLFHSPVGGSLLTKADIAVEQVDYPASKDGRTVFLCVGRRFAFMPSPLREVPYRHAQS